MAAAAAARRPEDRQGAGGAGAISAEITVDVSLTLAADWRQAPKAASRFTGPVK